MKQTTTKTKSASSDKPLFDNLNAAGDCLEYIQARTPADLLAMIRQIRLPTKILTIYPQGNFHIAWIYTTAKLIKE